MYDFLPELIFQFFHVGQTPEEGWSIYRPKRWEYNNKVEDNSPKPLKYKNHQASQKIRKLEFLYLKRYSAMPNLNGRALKLVCPIGWGCWIHRLLLCRGVKLTQWVSWIEETKQSDGEVPVMLELWWMRSTPSFPSLQGPIWPGMVESDRVLCMGQIGLNCLRVQNWFVWNWRIFDTESSLKPNWIVWFRTVWLNWNAWNRNVFDN